MVGAYSDNQPDYSWLQPFEERSFAMHWYPFRDIGGVKNANLDAAVNLEVQDGAAQLGFYATRTFPNAAVRLQVGDRVLLSRSVAIDPGHPFKAQVPLPAGLDVHDLRASLSAEGRELVAYSPVRLAPEPMPAPVTRPAAPKDIPTEEELFLAGQRIDQFHDPLAQADPYWAEALRRDPGDTKANTGLGLLDLRNARFVAAEAHFRKALARLTFNYTTPKDAEPLYYLGVALKAQGRSDEAFDAFYRAVWSQEWKSPAYFSLAEIASARGDFAAALDFADRSLDANALNVRAYGLKAAVLRHLGRGEEASAVLTFAAGKTDPLDARLMAERWLSAPSAATAQPLLATLDRFTDDAQELGAEYADAGLWRDGRAVLAEAVVRAPDRTKVSPIVYYYLGDFAEKLGDSAAAAAYRQQAAQQSPAYVFPFQAEVIPVLRDAIAANPRDARAPYYLGNLLFDWQPAEAVALWEKAAELDPGYPMTWRNLAQYYSHREDDASQAKAIACLEKAVALGDDYPTHFAELDQLYQAAGVPVEKRLALLERHQATVAKKDEGLASLIALKTFAGKPDEAIALLEGRTFSIWEGGTRFNTGDAWLDAHLVRGRQRLAAKQAGAALADFRDALSPPDNLRAEPRGPARVPEVYYWIGCAYAALHEGREAAAAWETATGIDLTETPRRGGGAPGNLLSTRGTQLYYQALARAKLAGTPAPEKAFRDLIASGPAALVPASGPAASFGPPIPARVRMATAHYLAGLGYAGLGEKDRARGEFDAALAQMPDYLGAALARNEL
jgi:tetratricopeptide (TPR) repeat protein